MSNVCPKCGYSGDNLIVDEGVSEYMVYMTCRMCNSSTTLEVNPTVEESEDNSISDNTSLDGKIDEEKPLEVPEVPDADETVSNELLEAPTLHIPNEVCPKCNSESIEIEMSTSKLGYITCRDCGYNSKSEGKRHRIGD